MKRSLKNVIAISAIIVLGVLSYFTMSSAKIVNATTTTNEAMQGGPMGDPPDKQSNSSSTNSSENTSTDSTQTTKPDGDLSTNSSEPPTKPDGDSSTNSSEPPAKPDGDSSTNSSEPPAKPDGDSSTNSSEPPAKPDGDSSTNSNETTTNSDESSNTELAVAQTNSETNSNSSSRPERSNSSSKEQTSETQEISTSYYIMFAIESLLISLLVIYLIMSNFNAKTIAETLSGASRIIIFVTLVLALTIGLTLLQGYLTKNVLSDTQSTTQESSDNNMQMPSNNSGAPSSNNGGNSSSATYTSSTEITEDTTIENASYSSTNEDENALLASGDIDATLSGITVEKTGDSDGGDSTSFYGTNSGILAKDGANLVLNNITVTTNANGANGVFCYGGQATTNNSSSDGTTVTISNSTITTTKDNSGGIMTTGGGIMNAYNLTVNTAGTSSAAIRTDRGGGTVTVDGGTYTTTGQGSPSIYSTADVKVSNSTLTSTTSEGIVIEGKNSVEIDNCELTDSNTKLNGKSTTYKNIFLYQSMSGDASNGTAQFTATNSKITTNNGDSFYVTNTTAEINLTNNTIVNNDSTGNFLRIQKDSWGNSGSNGGDVTLNMSNQKVSGNIVVDSISTLKMTMEENSYYEGTINADNSAESITLKLDSTSTIKLTGDSYVTSLEDADTTYSNIDFNGYTLYVNGVAIN